MAPIDALPPLREVIQRYELFAKKSLGQNFLLDLNLTSKVAKAAGSLAGVTVLEIGPGPGGLTRALLANGAQHVIAIERDARCLPALAEIARHYPGQLTVHEGDALEADWPMLLGGVAGPVRIIANLPYNIATPLLIGWLKSEPWPPWFESMTLMFQREVAERIVAAVGDDAYGRLAVLAGWRTKAEIVFDIPASAFTPPPKVTSSVVHLVPRSSPLPCKASDLERITQAAFGQRRKMLRQSLRSVFPEPIAPIEACGLRPQARAEEISVEGFVALAGHFLRGWKASSTDFEKDLMPKSKQHAWIFLSIGEDSTSLDQLILMADAINHAVPSQQELQESLRWLIEKKLISKNGRNYFLTDSGKKLRETHCKTITESWNTITEKFSPFIKRTVKN